MRIIDSDSEQRRVGKVNGLLKKVFGKRTQGNLMDYDYIPLPTQHKLGFIATGVDLPFLYKVVGQFTKDNGSEIKVLPKYAEKAKRYAEIYEEQFGSEATVIIDSRATEGAVCF